MKALTLTLTLSLALGSVLMVAPTAEAHPVEIGCGPEAHYKDWSEDYLRKMMEGEHEPPGPLLDAVGKVVVPNDVCMKVDCPEPLEIATWTEDQGHEWHPEAAHYLNMCSYFHPILKYKPSQG